MDRRNVLKATGATMIASQLPAQGATGNWDRAKLAQAADLMNGWIADGRVQGAGLRLRIIRVEVRRLRLAQPKERLVGQGRVFLR